MVMKDFSGGINTRVSPSLLQPNEAQVYENIESLSGAIVPLKGETLEQEATEPVFTWYYRGERFVFRSTPGSSVEFKNKLYLAGSEDESKLQVLNGEILSYIGIGGPSIAPVLSLASTPEGSGTYEYVGTLPAGTYEYHVHYQVEGQEENIVVMTRTIGDDLRIGVEIAGGGITKVSRKYDGEFRFITEEIFEDTWWDNTYNIAANELDEQILSYYSYCYTYYNSSTGEESQPSGITEITTFGDFGESPPDYAIHISEMAVSDDPLADYIRLYRLGGPLSQFTLVAEILQDAGPMSYDDFRTDPEIAGNNILDTILNGVPLEGLQFITEAYSMLFAAKDDKLYYSKIGEPTYWPASYYLDFEADITGIAPIQNGLIVFTKFKTFIITGTSHETFSKYLLSAAQGCVCHQTIQFIDNQLLWLSQDGLCVTTGGVIDVLSMSKLGKFTLTGVKNAQVLDRVYYVAHDAGILVVDFRVNSLIRTISLIVDWLGSYKDTMYFTRDGNLYTLFTGEPMTYKYKSPILTEGSYSNRKTFKDFYIKCTGDVEIKLTLDGKLLNTKELTGDTCHNLKALNTADGYGMVIELEGTAVVDEIEFKALGRQNGK